jgi:hypothetical protein
MWTGSRVFDMCQVLDGLVQGIALFIGFLAVTFQSGFWYNARRVDITRVLLSARLREKARNTIVVNHR